MSLSAAEDDSASEIHLPADVDWEMLDKSKFFFLGAALFSGVSGVLYPIVVLKTRQQVMLNDASSFKMAASIFRTEGCRGFYRGFGTSLMGTIPARALYMGALEVTKSNVGNVASSKLGFSEASASAVANAAAGKYNGGIDAFRKIIHADGVRGLYRGFGISILTYAPSNAVWWASYSIAHRVIWSCIGCYRCKKNENGNGNGGSGYRPDGKAVMAVQG
ncbi:UNVERIFIED_CONTAM: Mitochondrial substrate carrier family protein J [Sesamum radiatum]|uniref:Mitochondrial substrate carrier family protein J n=1 Tax=Sesamum radiatum TaxID=300843 RepID=A0AAW2TVN4_SESRA